ncbi:terpene synthase-like [Zophobas morio]|uniref:terpene synthase-like n=1 Tax=Zophobas morio TaxID=2755281 RepID=UPI0030835D2A
MTTSRPQMQIQDEEIILRPTLHITQAGREYKNIMRRIWRACNYWIKCPKDRQKIYGNIGEEFYNVALIVDDMEDHTILRRGIPAAHMLYGIPLMVQATIYRTILSLEELFHYLEDSKEEATDSLIKLGIGSFTGQGVEIHFTDIAQCPTFDDYRAIIYGNMLKNKPLEMESKKLFVDIMESFGSFEYTRKVLEDMKNGVFDEVDNLKLEKNPHLERVLEDIYRLN